jgi:hypothetical protein
MRDLVKISLLFDKECIGLENELKIVEGTRRKLRGNPISLTTLQTDLGLYLAGGGVKLHHLNKTVKIHNFSFSVLFMSVSPPLDPMIQLQVCPRIRG